MKNPKQVSVSLIPVRGAYIPQRNYPKFVVIVCPELV
jgi:hypothetical protein